MIFNTTLKKRERPIKAPERKFTIRKDNNINNWKIEWMSRKYEGKLLRENLLIFPCVLLETYLFINFHI